MGGGGGGGGHFEGQSPLLEGNPILPDLLCGVEAGNSNRSKVKMISALAEILIHSLNVDCKLQKETRT